MRPPWCLGGLRPNTKTHESPSEHERRGGGFVPRSTGVSFVSGFAGFRAFSCSASQGMEEPGCFEAGSGRSVSMKLRAARLQLPLRRPVLLRADRTPFRRRGAFWGLAEKPNHQDQRPFVCPCRPEGRFRAFGGTIVGGGRMKNATAPPIRRSGSGSLAARSFNLFHFVRADLRTRDILSTTGQNLETIMLCDIAKAMKTVLPFIYKGLLVSNEISRRRCRKKRRRCRRVIDRRC